MEEKTKIVCKESVASRHTFFDSKQFNHRWHEILSEFKLKSFNQQQQQKSWRIACHIHEIHISTHVTEIINMISITIAFESSQRYATVNDLHYIFIL